MANVPEYAAVKQKILGVAESNKNKREKWKKDSNGGKQICDTLTAKFDSDLSEIEKGYKEMEGIIKKWTPRADVIVGLQTDLKKAKQKKDKLAEKEIEQKIKINDTQAEKIYKQTLDIAQKLKPMRLKLEDLSGKIEKI